MPIHQMKCSSCGHQTRTLTFKPGRPAASRCEMCGSWMSIELGAELVFKGNGFYKTDYAPTEAPEVDVTDA